MTHNSEKKDEGWIQIWNALKLHKGASLYVCAHGGVGRPRNDVGAATYGLYDYHPLPT